MGVRNGRRWVSDRDYRHGWRNRSAKFCSGQIPTSKSLTVLLLNLLQFRRRKVLRWIPTGWFCSGFRRGRLSGLLLAMPPTPARHPRYEDLQTILRPCPYQRSTDTTRIINNSANKSCRAWQPGAPIQGH